MATALATDFRAAEESLENSAPAQVAVIARVTQSTASVADLVGTIALDVGPTFI
jgi:hypothetical protein